MFSQAYEHQSANLVINIYGALWKKYKHQNS
jgi:hypothetical protein